MTLIKRLWVFSWVAVILLALVSTPLISKEKKKVREYLTTIRWYPATSQGLNEMVGGFFKNAKLKKVPGKIKGIISPHAGLSYSGQCAANGYIQLETLDDIERVILLGVSHRSGFYGAAVSDFDYNSTPLGLLTVDTEITAKLAKAKMFKKSNSTMQNEHSLENQLPFLQYVLKKKKNEHCKIVPILISYLDRKDYKKIAAVIKPYVTDKTVVVASTDFTHYGSSYGYTPFRKNIKNNLKRLDMGMIDCIRRMDLGCYFKYKKETKITMCGFAPVGVLMSIFDEEGHIGTLTDYYKSGDRGNDYSFSVSYASLVISKHKATAAKMKNQAKTGIPSFKEDNGPMKLNEHEKKALLTMARQTIEDHFKGKTTAMEAYEKKYKLSAKLKEKTGVFVTLKKKGHLRGCIGTIIGREPLSSGVRNNALKAAFEDPRFGSLKEKELAAIDMEISVMTPLQKLDDYKKIRLGTDGVIIRKGYNQAVFLPQVATETGWDLDRFLGQLCRKAGLAYDAYRSPDMDFFIFQALVFDEKELKLR
jgi:AmmeMemoRadiSam system protein B/AmmeMemoRadiSam system protein A